MMLGSRLFARCRGTLGAVPVRYGVSRVSGTPRSINVVRWQSCMDSPIKPAKIINAVPDLHFSITNRAANRLADIYKTSREILRVTVESGGCHGFQYNLKLVPESDKKGVEDAEGVSENKNEDDLEDDFDDVKDIVYVLPDSNAQVVIDEQSLKILNNTTLTYTTELIGSTFKITGGNMTSSCGCGSSFGLDEQAL